MIQYKTNKEKLIFDLINQGFTPDQATNEVENFPNEAESLAQRKGTIKNNNTNNGKQYRKETTTEERS